MKLKIFNRGKGWYAYATNYKNKEDKLYYSVYFVNGYAEAPEYVDNGRGFSTQDIKIEEAALNCYEGKPGFSIFKYELLSNIDLKEDYSDNFKGDRADSVKSVEISSEDLPWY